jgi:hypothetical protein
MFDKEKIQTALFGLVGFEQPYNPDYAILEPDLLVSRSGRYATENPYAKIEYFKDSQDYKDISDSEFNELLRRTVYKSISNICASVFDKPSYIDRNLFYRYALNKADGVDDIPEGFIGYEILPSNRKNLAFELKRVILNFDLGGATGETIELMLFNSSIDTPIYSEVITLTDTNQEVELNWVVNNTSSMYKGEYYLGYNYSNSVSYKPYKRDYNAANVLTCFKEIWMDEVKVVGHNTSTLFNLENTDGLSLSTGLNFDMTVYDDYTDLIINNERLFAEAIEMSIAIEMINTYRFSLRSNRNQRKSEEHLIRVIQEIEGQDEVGSVKIVGLRNRLSGKLTKLKKEIDKLRKGYFGGMIMVDTRS